MQQTLEKRRGNFGAGLFASVALHVAIAALLLFRLPPAAPEPEKEDTVKVEMVPEPEKKPQPEKKPEPEKKQEPEKKPEKKPAEKRKPQVEPRQQAEKKPAEKPVTPGKSGQRPAEKQAETQKNQAFESAAKEGGKEAGGDRPSEPLLRPEVEPRADRATPPVESRVTEKADEAVQKPDAGKTSKASKLPELDLSETETAREILNEGEADIRTVPTPALKPEQKPSDVTLLNRQQSASADSKSADAGSLVPPSDLPKAKELFTADALSNPRARQALGKLPPNRRIVQICNFEALEQIRHARPETLPEGLVPFSDGGGLISGQVLRATGGAFVSRRVWYDIEFECAVDEEFRSVTSFRFAIGKVVPERERKARGLPND
jgi:Domain of Unknown Function (DUF930)